jgi:hypothetical protein
MRQRALVLAILQRGMRETPPALPSRPPARRGIRDTPQRGPSTA